MDVCRLCKTKIKTHQIYCPECGAKLPALSKEELEGFRRFKKKFRPIFFTTLITLLIFLALFAIKIPDTETMSYKVKISSSELKPVETSLECVEEDFLYSINSVELQASIDVLKIECNIENLEDEQGIFEYTAIISYKLSLEEKQENSELLLGPYENKTVSAFFKNVRTTPSKVDYFCKVTPPKKRVCETKTEHALITEEKEETKAKQKKVSKSLFELILEKID